MKKYHDMLKHILEKGVQKGDRTGTGTTSVFGYQERFDLSEGFPLVTTKKIHWKSVAHELLWLISGSTNIKYLKDNGVTIWDEWADARGELGPVYGKQWRKWTAQHDPDYADQRDAVTIDQLAEVVERIKTKPDDRRLIVTAWNPADVPKQKLPPCHAFFQFNTRPLTLRRRQNMVTREDLLRSPDPFLVSAAKGMQPGSNPASYFNVLGVMAEELDQCGIPTRALDCHMYQRSADAFLGVPFNIASYSLLTMMVAQVVGMVPGEFIHSFGDLHIYSNHMEQVKEQLSRGPVMPGPTVRLNPEIKNIDDFRFEDIELIGYEPWPAIKAPVAV